MMLDPDNEAAATPGAGHLVRAAFGSIARRIRTAAINVDGLVGGRFQRLAIFVSTRLSQEAERRRLQSLSDHMLRDMGVSHRDVGREAGTRWYDM
jgi:uncharacterized protein YjiS (DUF1127 family)